MVTNKNQIVEGRLGWKWIKRSVAYYYFLYKEVELLIFLISNKVLCDEHLNTHT